VAELRTKNFHSLIGLFLILSYTYIFPDGEKKREKEFFIPFFVEKEGREVKTME
jgi:hypothetical protein